MQSRMLSWMVALVGVLLIGAALLPGPAASVRAAPLLALTPTAEPPTPTNTPAPTDTPVPTNTPELPPPATPSAVLPTPTPGEPPTATPPPPTNTPTRPNNPPNNDGFADPAIVKTVSASTARIGDVLVFTMSVTNLGNIAAENVTVTDTMPNEFDVIEATTSAGTVTVSGRSITANIGTVQPGEVVTVRVVVRVNESALPSRVQNLAVVTTTTPGDNPNNNTSSVTVEIVPGVAPSATPTPGEAALAPTPTPTPATPAQLPATGGDGGSTTMILLLIGLALVGASLLLPRRASR